MMSFSDSFKKIVEAVAPTLGKALGGPFGALAGTFIANKLEKTTGDTKAIEDAVMSGNPDVMVKLKQAENDFKAHIADIGLSEDKLAFDDTANARAREIAVRDSTPRVLAYGTTIGFFLALLGLNLMPIPAENRATIYSMVGSLGTVWILVMGYYFGSSRGSDDKSKVLADIAKQP
jgi:hypothetical protein